MPKPSIQILVCTNQRPPEAAKPCCLGRGSLAVYYQFKDRVRARGLRDTVMVTRTGCLKHCSRGTTVAIWPGNTWYAAVTSDDVDEILEAVFSGQEVTRLRMPEISWE